MLADLEEDFARRQAVLLKNDRPMSERVIGVKLHFIAARRW
jgi:hypothetical protein